MPFDIIRIRRDTLANWTSVNPTLALGEISYDLTNHEIRVGDGTSAWLDLPTIGNAAIANGDKGDIVVTGGGTTWTLDPSIVATINNKLDQGPLDGGNATTGDQVIQVRRDTTVGWTTSGTILGNGEMGYDSTLVELRIGNGVDIWENLDPIGINKAGSTNLVMLADVDYPLSSPADGEVLTFDTATDNWINKALPAVSLGLNDLTNVTLTSPSNTQILQFNGTEWVNAPAPTSAGGTLTSGSKNHINVINTASDWQINNNVITQDMLNLQMPTNPEDASTKGYTDSIVGLAISANVTEELDQANGIAVLNSSRVISTDRLGSGSASSSNFLRGDNTWAVPLVDTSNILQGSATTNQVLAWNGSSWGPATITGGTDILQHLYMDGTSFGNFTWRTNNVGAGSQNHPEYFDFTGGFMLTTTGGGDNERWWLHQTALADYDIIDHDMIVKWNGQINTWDSTDMYCIVGAFITHAQADWTLPESGLQRVIGFITSSTGNTWRCSVWNEPTAGYEEVFGVDTSFLISDEHTLQVVICDQGTKAVFYVDGAIVAETENNLSGAADTTSTSYAGIHVRHLGTSTTPSVVRTNSLETFRLIQDSCVTPGVMLASVDSSTTSSVAVSDLTDVLITSPATNDLLLWNNTSTRWENIPRDTILAGGSYAYNRLFPALPQQGTSRLVWWNASSGLTRTLVPSATGQATLTLDETANTMVIDVPAQDATLTALAGVTTSADTVIFATGSDTFTTTPLTSTARTLLDDTSTSAMRTTLGLGTMATQDASTVSITGGTISGATVTTGTYSSPLNQAVMKLVRNNTGSTIAKGKVVRITGSLGDNLTVALADATDESTSASTIGITAESIADSADGFIITQGVLTNLTGIDTPLVNGDLLWLSETAGEFTRTRPTAPAHGVVIGWVMSTSSGSAGRIYVKIDNGYELNELHNVSIPSTPSDKDLLAWDNSTGVWKNMTKTTAGFGTLATLNTVGTSEITALSVTNAKLANSSITPVKLSNQSTTNSLVGFDDTGVGDYYTAGSGIVIDGSTMTISATASGGAPVGATYIVQTSDGTLTNEQALGSLATGILKNTTSTGVLSIATGSDLPSHTHAAADITSGVIATARLGSGTADTTTFLRGDGSWQSVSGSGMTFQQSVRIAALAL